MLTQRQISGVGAVVLAGGRSRRMGRDKALLLVSGETYLERTVRVLSTLAEPIVVVAAQDQPLPALVGAAVLRDELPFEGPLLGVVHGLKALDGRCSTAVVCATDHPYLKPSVLRRLAELLPGFDAAILQREQPELLCAVYSMATLAVAQRVTAGGERSLRALGAALRVRWVSVEELLADADVMAEDPMLRSFDDVDEPHELPSP